MTPSAQPFSTARLVPVPESASGYSASPKRLAAGLGTSGNFTGSTSPALGEEVMSAPPFCPQQPRSAFTAHTARAVSKEF